MSVPEAEEWTTAQGQALDILIEAVRSQGQALRAVEQAMAAVHVEIEDAQTRIAELRGLVERGTGL